jgi:4-diphosphocytidyl-2-C-methyl-D-erythritol kinase
MYKKSYPKVNIFLKISGKRDNYHEIVSRFVLVKNIYDIIEFKKSKCNNFKLDGNFNCATKNNTIYKAYMELYKMFKNVGDYFKHHKVIVKKNIPEFAGLGGGSSNCATFLNMVNKVCNLKLSKKELATIGLRIGADVPFFIYEYESANVTGIGEIVDEFKEDKLEIRLYTPQIKCDTKEIFKVFSNKFYKEISKKESKKLLNTKSIDILNNTCIKTANDLYEPALSIYANLLPSNYNLPSNTFFSGSGSSFFYIKTKDK